MDRGSTARESAANSHSDARVNLYKMARSGRNFGRAFALLGACVESFLLL